MKILETDRLILRTWVDEDLESMFAINQDPKVMEYFPSLQDLDMTKNFIDKVNAHFENHGYSLYATVRKDTNEFIGFIRLLIADFESHFTPATEIGWRLSSNHLLRGKDCNGISSYLAAGEVEHFVIKQVRHILKSLEIAAQNSIFLEQAGLNKAQVFELLKDIDGVWQNLFPIEQQKIIQTLIRTVLVGTDGVDVRINQEGLHSLVLETQDEVMA